MFKPTLVTIKNTFKTAYNIEVCKDRVLASRLNYAQMSFSVGTSHIVSYND